MFFDFTEEISELRVLDLSWNMIYENDIRPICISLKVKIADID